MISDYVCSIDLLSLTILMLGHYCKVQIFIIHYKLKQ